MKKRPVIYLLICALSCARPAVADEYGDMFSIMFRMMLSMMKAMSDVAGDSTDNLGWGGGNSLGLGMTTLPMMGGMTGMSPWGMSGMNPWSGYGGIPLNNMGLSPWSPALAGNPWSNPYSGGYNPFMSPAYTNPYGMRRNGYPAGYGVTNPLGQYSSSGLLNGRWYGNTGEILEVRGNQFRLKNRKTVISGTVSIKDNIVNLLAKQTRTVTQYTFARNQSQLILRDAAGQVLVFQQNPLNRGIRTF